MTGDLIRVRSVLSGLALPSGGVCTMYFADASAPVSTTVTAIRNFWTALLPVMSNQIQVDIDPIADQVQEATGGIVGTFTLTPGASQVGSSSGNLYPLQTQGLIRWGTGAVVSGRRLRGQTFIPAPTIPGAGATSVPAGSYVSAVTGAATGLIGGTSTGNPFVIYSRTHHEGHTTTTGVCDPKFSVLRSRRT